MQVSFDRNITPLSSNTYSAHPPTSDITASADVTSSTFSSDNLFPVFKHDQHFPPTHHHNDHSSFYTLPSQDLQYSSLVLQHPHSEIVLSILPSSQQPNDLDINVTLPSLSAQNKGPSIGNVTDVQLPLTTTTNTVRTPSHSKLLSKNSLIDRLTGLSASGDIFPSLSTDSQDSRNKSSGSFDPGTHTGIASCSRLASKASLKDRLATHLSVLKKKTDFQDFQQNSLAKKLFELFDRLADSQPPNYETRTEFEGLLRWHVDKTTLNSLHTRMPPSHKSTSSAASDTFDSHHQSQSQSQPQPRPKPHLDLDSSSSTSSSSSVNLLNPQLYPVFSVANNTWYMFHSSGADGLQNLIVELERVKPVGEWARPVLYAIHTIAFQTKLRFIGIHVAHNHIVQVGFPDREYGRTMKIAASYIVDKGIFTMESRILRLLISFIKTLSFSDTFLLVAVESRQARALYVAEEIAHTKNTGPLAFVPTQRTEQRILKIISEQQPQRDPRRNKTRNRVTHRVTETVPNRAPF